MTSTATSLIKSEAKRLGFSHTGISSACFLEQEAPRLEKWLKNNMHGNMSYMERNFDKRLDPRLLVDGAKSVVSFVLNYFPEAKQIDPEAPKISRYAYGKDYHQVIKEKLFQLLNFIRENIGEVNGRAFVDSAPVLDKAWAQKSGLGWIGKNSNLINPKNGSYFFIAELILDIELEPDLPITDYCGTCTKCIDACPTQAIIKPYVVDGSKCISYFTIELKDAFPESLKNNFDDWVFGCDVCQEVCPWNRFSKPTQEPAFHPREGLLEMSKSDWYEITEDVFNKVFKDSAVQRTGFEGLKRNLEFLKNQ
ncbi:MAG: tRNA epoxyqueuosine(34) reductase QueG [Bacteroidia bacterium]|nr:tRNA epoxyqueuosine(34) reductase QueG [Bacteroidota bacterium]MBK8872593.1 tRNA epoxyqueuosine(34) reductase QueG [Bacteroidota bacterium]MBP9082567.1 tRNA epoxyqueuosine(34) reductase QueG [Bacteroidia bacterium]